jgi:hypothetical protein
LDSGFLAGKDEGGRMKDGIGPLSTLFILHPSSFPMLGGKGVRGPLPNPPFSSLKLTRNAYIMLRR